MKKTFRIILAVLLVMAMSAIALPAFAKEGEPVPVKGNTYTNEWISFTVANDGRVESYTTAAGEKLLYGYWSDINARTSYTTVSIGGSRYQYGASLTVAPDFNGKTNYSAQNYNGVLVEQKLTIVPNDVGDESIVEWRYTYTNNTSSTQNVGCRIMLDTCLNDNNGDDAPFRLPNVPSITKETEITSNIPRIWFTYHPTTNLTAQGGFYDGEIAPDKVQFGEWRERTGVFFYNYYGLYVTSWDYQIDSSRSFTDAAVAATWNEEPLAPGESREYVTYYGLGEVMQQGEGSLTITVNGDHACVANETEDGYNPSPAYVMGILSNEGNGALTGVYEYAVLPEGLSFAEGTNAYYAAGNLAAGAETEYTWNFVVDEVSTEDRWFSIYIYYGCDGMEESFVVWRFFVPGIEAPIVIEEPVPPVVVGERVELRSRSDRDARADLRFLFRVIFNDSNVTYKTNTYGPAEDYAITSFYTMLTANGNTIKVNGVNIYEMYGQEDEVPYYTYSALIKNIKEVNFDAVITATPYVEYVRVETGVTGVATCEPLMGSVNGVANS